MKSEIQKHYNRIRYVLIIVLALNWLVASAKIFYGFLSKCESMAADGFHSLADGASNIIGLIGIHFACQPIDKDHPYGHKKYETFFALGIAAMLFIVAFNLAKEGVTHLFIPSAKPVVDLKSFIVMLATMGINIWVMNYERREGKKLQSDILISDAMHTNADIFTSASVIIALIVIKLGYPILDPIATVLISLFIAHAGYDIIKQSSNVLCDTVALDVRKIESIVLEVKGVKACHKIRSRGRPDDIHIDLHVQVNPDMHVDNAHRISYAIEEAIKKGIPEITDVVVHIEPKEKI
ncbi:MAG: cation diffusion facilitator family transporter [Candidatus Omnitrophica bacterium]|nr:cation diffusion facilitator family transporter [Candidatus Omnitrophota bacterium]